MRNILLVAAALLYALVTPLSAVDRALYPDYSDLDNLFPDPCFKDTKAWNLNDEFTFVPADGQKDAHILVVKRSDKAVETYASRDFRLAPGTYNFTAEVKVEPGTGLISPFVEFYDRNNTYLYGGIYPVSQSTQWQELTSNLVIPPEAVRVRLGFHLKPGSTGTGYLRKVRITPAEIYSAYLLEPAQPGRMIEGRQRLLFGTLDTTTPAATQAKIELFDGEKPLAAVTSPIVGNRVRCEMEIPQCDQGMLRFTFLGKNGKAKDVTDIPIKALPHDTRVPANAALLDDRGRLTVNGKRILPLGVFLNHSDGRMKSLPHNELEKDLEILGKSPFNTILPYDFLLLGRSDGKPESDIPRVTKFLDLAARNHLKVILSVKDIRQEKPWWTNFAGNPDEKQALARIVGTFKEHPALLGWYVFDEDPQNSGDYHRQRRSFINALDPWHPTLMVLMKPDENAATLGGTADIYAPDPYEINEKSVPHGLNGFIAWMNLTLKFIETPEGGAALWNCPQIFNMGHWRNPGPEFIGHDKYAYPSEVEMRTQNLLALLMGARGLMMYSYFDLFTGPDAKEFERRWPEVCRAAEAAGELADYVLSDQAPEKVALTGLRGKVMARRFIADDGREAVILIGVGPGESQARFSLPRGKWSSRFGGTVQLGNGRWQFTGSDIASDVLYKEK